MACINAYVSDAASHLTATVVRVGTGLKALLNPSGDRLSATIQRIGNGLNAVVVNAVVPIKAGVSDVASHLNARVSIICSVSEAVYYLNVTPEEVQWITDDAGVFYDVESNVEWIIE